MVAAIGLYVVIREQGARWVPSLPMEEQSGWREHADFMNGLAERGFVVLGGPVGEKPALLIVRASGEEEIRATLANDPWSEDFLVIRSIEPWTIRLGDEPG